MTLLKISDLTREPEFHLRELLEVLRLTPDGYSTEVIDAEAIEADTGNESVIINPEYQCGFDEAGDGHTLTVITQRLADSRGGLILSTDVYERPEHRDTVNDVPYLEVRWNATVILAQEYSILGPMNGDPNPRAGQTGSATCSKPGTAALVAYLRAWGTVI